MKILVAHDEAFNFTYRANIDRLREMGEVQFFSPLHDNALFPFPCADAPAHSSSPLGETGVGLYLPGGYPELFASQLSANADMRRAIRDFAERGGHIFAECGGFMYLCQDIDGVEMCGVLPLRATMQNARLHLGYRQMEWSGSLIKGHEFHYSSVLPTSLPQEVEVIRGQKSATGRPVDTPIYRYKNVIAGYTHWYWGNASENLSNFPMTSL